MSSLTPPTRIRRVHYPESDGKPIAESDLHRDLMADIIFALKWFLQGATAYVSGKLFIYFEEGNPRAVIDPDIFVIIGIEQRQRRHYKTWEEGGRLPDVIIELTSRKTRKIDQTKKPLLYAQLGIHEYFIFDPYGDYLKPKLQGFRLVCGSYVPLSEHLLHSEVLGLELRAEGDELRLYNVVTGERLATRDEVALLRRQAERATAEAERATAEAQARREAEAEVARLRALLDQRGA